MGIETLFNYIALALAFVTGMIYVNGLFGKAIDDYFLERRKRKMEQSGSCLLDNSNTFHSESENSPKLEPRE